MSRRRPPEPPEGLSPASLAIWREETTTRTWSQARLAMLTDALRARDRAARLRASVGADAIVTGGKIPHVHPAIKAAQEEERTFAKLARALSLEWNMGIDGSD